VNIRVQFVKIRVYSMTIRKKEETQEMLTKKGRFVVEYSLILVVTIGVLLTIQNYLKRAMQGEIKAAAEQIGEQYDYGFTQGVENLYSTTHIYETTTAGWNHPTTHTETEGSYSSTSVRSLRPLKSRPPN
jgi:hypothetical protein